MSEHPLIALTGATGFIGRRLLAELPRRGFRLRVLLRRPTELSLQHGSAVIGDLARPQNMASALADVDAVIHSAGVAHAMSGIPADDYRVLNTEATIALARAAERARVKRFIFLSSIRAQTGPSAEGVVTETMPARPTDDYGRSKLAAEEGLAALGIDWVALRPVLVYGPGVKGNVAALVNLARSPYPLPFGGLSAKRSVLSVDNLVDAIAMVLGTTASLRRPLIVADDTPLSVGEMIAALRSGLNRRPGLLPVPAPMLGWALRAAGRPELFERIAGPLVADAAELRALGWTPRTDSRAGLAALARE
jgi:nucleoside-diphosphate-sugar epimerase